MCRAGFGAGWEVKRSLESDFEATWTDDEHLAVACLASSSKRPNLAGDRLWTKGLQADRRL